MCPPCGSNLVYNKYPVFDDQGHVNRDSLRCYLFSPTVRCRILQSIISPVTGTYSDCGAVTATCPCMYWLDARAFTCEPSYLYSHDVSYIYSVFSHICKYSGKYHISIYIGIYMCVIYHTIQKVNF